MSENMTCEQILRDLTYCDNEFPDDAIQAARSKRDELIPGLIETIRNATEKSIDGGVVYSMGHIMAMLLLKEFNAKQERLRMLSEGVAKPLTLDEFKLLRSFCHEDKFQHDPALLKKAQAVSVIINRLGSKLGYIK